jgi:hypothetical protein
MGAVNTAGRGVVEVLSPEREKTETTGRAVMVRFNFCDPQIRAGRLLIFWV